MILIGERSLRRAVRQFCEHYHAERNHQGIENRIIKPDFGTGGEGESIVASEGAGCCATITAMPHKTGTI